MESINKLTSIDIPVQTDLTTRFVTSLEFAPSGDVITGDSEGRLWLWSRDDTDSPYYLSDRCSDLFRSAHKVRVRLRFISSWTLLSHVIDLFHNNRYRGDDARELITLAGPKSLPLQFIKVKFSEELGRCREKAAAPGGRSEKQKGAYQVADHFAAQVTHHLPQEPKIQVGCYSS